MRKKSRPGLLAHWRGEALTRTVAAGVLLCNYYIVGWIDVCSEEPERSLDQSPSTPVTEQTYSVCARAVEIMVFESSIGTTLCNSPVTASRSCISGKDLRICAWNCWLSV